MKGLITQLRHSLIIIILVCHNTEPSKLKRNKRFLIFPRQAPTRHQFIGGIGIPADLSYESLTIGHVLKAEYWLPWNATTFRENPYLPEYKIKKINSASNDQQNFINGRSQRNRKSFEKKSSLRWDAYQLLGERFHGYGYKGQECVLKAICEANHLPFMKQFDVFGEIMHIFFSPSTSEDAHSPDARHFLEAEKQGSTNHNCDIYECQLSLLDLISEVMKIN